MPANDPVPQRIQARVTLREGAVADGVAARLRELLPEAERVSCEAADGALRIVIVLRRASADEAVHHCRPRITLAVADGAQSLSIDAAGA